MKKIIIAAIIGLAIGAVSSPVIGMAIGSTRSLILGMAPDEAILTLANKIDEESGKNEEQEQKIAELNQAKAQQDEEMESLKKTQEIATCQKRKEDCEDKIYKLENGELEVNRPGVWKGSRTEMIKKLQDLIDGWKKDKKEYSGDSEDIPRHLQDSIDNAEKEIAKIKQIMASEAVEKNNLLNGECKDYQNPCE